MKKIFILLFSAAATVGYGATWTEVKSFNGSVNDLKAFNSLLFVGGDFTSSNGAAAYYSSFYNGTTFTHNTTSVGGTGISEMAVFNNEVYNVGGMNFGAVTGVAKWTSPNWSSEGLFTQTHNSIVVKDNELFVGSDFNGQISFKTGTAGSYGSLPALGGGAITAMAVYNNELYAAGTFILYGTTVMNNIARWNGTTWVALGTGINAGVTGTINTMVVYNSELYVAGTISTAGGMSVNNIAKWNGTSWSAVGSGINSAGSGVLDMAVMNNNLYVVGDFTTAGGFPSENAAKWDGTTWTAIGLIPSHQPAKTVEAYNNKIYVGTQDADTGYVYRLDSEVGFTELNNTSRLSLYPNPATDVMQITLDAPYAKLQVVITDLAGRLVFQEDKQNATGIITINVANLPKGEYVLMLLTNDQRRTLPFVKQ